MVNEQFVTLIEPRGEKLDRPVSITESMIKDMQDLYIRNLVRICRSLKVKKITPFSMLVEDRWTHNPYIDYNDRQLFYKLGKSCVEDGMHWLFIIKDNSIFEGIHRILALQELVNKGEYTDEELEFPALDISQPQFEHPVKIEFYKFRTDFNRIRRFGLDKRYYWYTEYYGARANFMSMSAMLKYVYYEWKQKYGKEFPQPECINNYDKLMELVESELYRD